MTVASNAAMKIPALRWAEHGLPNSSKAHQSLGHALTGIDADKAVAIFREHGQPLMAGIFRAHQF